MFFLLLIPMLNAVGQIRKDLVFDSVELVNESLINVAREAIKDYKEREPKEESCIVVVHTQYFAEDNKIEVLNMLYNQWAYLLPYKAELDGIDVFFYGGRVNIHDKYYSPAIDKWTRRAESDQKDIVTFELCEKAPEVYKVYVYQYNYADGAFEYDGLLSKEIIHIGKEGVTEQMEISTVGH